MPNDPLQCPRCTDKLVDGKMYCPNCGLAILAGPSRIAIDSYVQAKVDQQVTSRMIDETGAVRKIADSAEDILWARIKRYSWIVGLAVLILGIYGFNSIKDAKSTIVNDAKGRLEPILSETERRVKSAQEEIARTDQTIQAVQNKLNATSKLADSESNRISTDGGEINQKLAAVQQAADRANTLGASFEKQEKQFEQEIGQMRSHAEDLSHKLDATQKTFDVKIAEATKQIDNVSIQRAYPTLGQKMYVTFNGQPWKGRKQKGPTDKWVNINLDPYAIGETRVTQDQLQALSDAMEKAGFTPYFGLFGFGGGVSGGYGSLGNSSATGIRYFNESQKDDASKLLRIAVDTLKIPDMTVQHSVGVDHVQQTVINDSGLDFQIFIGPSR